MDLWTLAGIVLRRWLFVLPAVVATAVAVVVLVVQAPPQYAAAASFVIVPAHPVGTPDQTVEAASGLQLTAEVLAEVARSDAVRQRVAAAEGNDDYVVEVADTGPLLRVRVGGPDPARAVRGVTAAMDEIAAGLDRQQADAGTPPEGRVTISELARPVEAREVPVPPDTPARFEASGSLLLQAPSETAAGGGAGVNPYDRLGTSMPAVLAEATGRRAFAQRLAAAGAGAAIAVSPDPVAPIVRVTASGTDAEETVRTVHAVFDGLVAEMDAEQDAADAPEVGRFTLELLGTPQAEPAGNGRLRPLLAIAAIGGLAAVGSALAAETLLTRRRRDTPAGPSGGEGTEAERRLSRIG